MSQPILNIVDDKIVLELRVPYGIQADSIIEQWLSPEVRTKLNTVASGGDGRQVELQASATHIQWRYVGDVSWINLIALSELEGPQGPTGQQGIQGETGLTGPQGPQGETGLTGAQGPQGEQGPSGTNGTDGKTVLNGSSDPTTEGVDGDFYINTTTDTIFGPKTAGSWGSGTPLVGPQGPQGIQGEQGLTGPEGPQGIQGIQGETGPAGTNGVDGDSAYVYIAYASDDSGTGFTTTFNAALDYIAILSTSTEIATPVAGDFTGLWKNYKGAPGEVGEAIERQSNTVIFSDMRGYIIGKTTPITGNILFDFTGAKLGSTTMMIHQSASAFTIPATGKKLNDKAASTTVANYIYFTLVDDTPAAEVVHYTISQEVV